MTTIKTPVTNLSRPHLIPAANEPAFAIVPEFCMTAPALREAVDQIADHAMAGLEQVTAAMARAPADMLPILTGLRALFGSIGHAADATAADIGVDLGETWAVAAA